ncbi:MAG: cysteine hydrolase family protein [Flavobacteriales bacterium]|nr:cysteine hydrolase family protein [Flavobacteriales bacterium]
MDLKKLFFWNVDTQNDFMDEKGALYIPDAKQIRPTLKAITLLAREKNIPVVSTADYHYDDSAEIAEIPDFKSTFPSHCMAETDGADFIDETSPKNALYISWEEKYMDFDMSYREFIVSKDAFDVFNGNPNMDDFMETLYDETGRDTAVVYGVSGNVCVKYAVDGLREREFKVILITDAIKSLPDIPDPTQSEEWTEDEGLSMMTFDEFKAQAGL